MRSSGFLLCALLVGACSNDLDPKTCDDAMARTVVYDDVGFPYYEGQALIVSSCGPCHETVADTSAADAFATRNGAPHDLSWDLDYQAVSPATLRAGQLESYRMRGDIWSQVAGGHMPPLSIPSMPGAGDPAAHATHFVHADGTTKLLPLRDMDGRHTAILRNWLACGLPVVQGTPVMPGPSGADAIGDVVDCNGPCALDPTWNATPNSIYPGLIRQRCAVSGCHADTVDLSHFQMPRTFPETPTSLTADAHAAYLALVGPAGTGVASMSTSCAGLASVGNRVTPGDPDHSLLVNKLEGVDASGMMVCGPRMPLGDMMLSQAAYIDPIREWIMSGAHE